MVKLSSDRDLAFQMVRLSQMVTPTQMVTPSFGGKRKA